MWKTLLITVDLCLLMTVPAVTSKSITVRALDDQNFDSGAVNLQTTTSATTTWPPTTASVAKIPRNADFNRSVANLIRDYARAQAFSRLHIAAHFTGTLEGLSEEVACETVNKYINTSLQTDGERGKTCTPTYSCDFNEARFPATLIKVTCPEVSCIVEKSRYKSRGACLSSEKDLKVLRFIEEEGAGDYKTDTGSGEEDHYKQGTWYYYLTPLVRDCYCTDDK